MRKPDPIYVSYLRGEEQCQMESQDNTSRYIPIPQELYATDTGKPFDHCLMCNCFLLEEETPYMIEKSIKQHPELDLRETIFEYAMCMDCAIRMNASLSEESRERIGAYFARHANLGERSEALLPDRSNKLQSWISHCVIKKTPISQAREYQVVAQCEGTNLLFSYMPFALSFEAMDEMTALMSAKSLGEMDDFIDKYFSGPPEVAELLRKKFVII
jgi:hypothetical protein